jgi:hypothetical protein
VKGTHHHRFSVCKTLSKSQPASVVTSGVAWGHHDTAEVVSDE